MVLATLYLLFLTSSFEILLEGNMDTCKPQLTMQLHEKEAINTIARDLICLSPS